MAGARVIAILCLFATAVLADQQAESRAREELQQRFARQREVYQLSLRDLVAVPERRMSQIMRLRVENGRLVVQTSLKPTPNPVGRRVDIEGFGSPAIVTYCEFLSDHPEARQFEFKVQEYPNRSTSAVIRLLWRPGEDLMGELEIESTWQTRDRFSRVVYQQNPWKAELIGSGAGNSSAQDAQNVHLVERDFATLRQKHPAATEEWLRPVLRRLQQNAIFAADSNAAWQALIDVWPIDPEVDRQVGQLVPQLNSADWQTRHRAAGELAKLGRDGATSMARLSRTGLSLEQNVRLDAILSRFRPLPPDELRPLRTSPDFLLDCLYGDDATVRRLAAARLSQVLGRKLNLNIDAPEPLRSQAIEKIRTELKPADAPR